MFTLTITAAGLDALVDAQSGATDPIVISEIGLTETAFVAAPTLVALPGEIKRIVGISGQSVAENVIHLTAQDSTTDTYDLRGFALFLADGTLFAAYSQPDPIVSKVSIAAFLISLDVAFAEAIDADIEFGDATFLFPPATETVKGAIEIATQAETDTGTDDSRAITPLKLATRLAAALAGVAASIAALAGRTITGGGLATGGGDLNANRVITVTAASAAEADAGVIATKALTPASIVNVLAAIAGLLARTVTGAGLATGGGSLAANRVITVPAASGAEIAVGTEAGKAVTPAAMAAVDNGYAGNISVRGLGGSIIKIGVVSVSIPAGATVTFPVAFPVACDAVLVNPMGNMNTGDERDEAWWVTGLSASGFSIGTNDDGNTVNFQWVAFGH